MELWMFVTIILAFIILLLFLLLKFKNETVNSFKYLGGKLKKLKIQTFTVPLAIAIIVILYIFVPDKMYYFLFLGIFTVGLYFLIHYLMSYIYIISLDWSKNELEVIELSNRAFNNYRIIDETGKEDTVRYWLKCKSGRMVVVDSIDTKNKTMVVNPIFSSFDFLKNYKDVDLQIKKMINDLVNKLAEFEGRFEYETVMKAKKILESSSLLSTIAEPQKETPVENKSTENKADATSQNK